MAKTLCGSVAAAFVLALALSGGAAAAPPGLGPNVIVFDSSMPTSQIQATVDTIASKQVSNQFGTERYALLFKPGTYGSSSDPLNFQVGYYTSIAGLGRSPGDVVINGSVYVHNQCDGTFCTALNNFWRSLSNLTINVTTPNFGCYNGEFWAGSQQQWLARNSALVNWTNGVWNQVFSGVVGAPAECFPAQASCGGPYTTLPTSPVTREAPYLYVDSGGNQNVFVPSAQKRSSGTTWADGATPGTSISIDRFYIAKPSDSAATINSALRTGRNLILTPGIYHLDQSISVTRPDTVVLGLGFPTLIPTNGNAAMTTASAKGILISGVMFDAGPVNSPVLLQVGSGHARSDNESSDPSTLSDVFFRIGGAEPGSATTSHVVNSNNVILDDIWAWRADHGNGVGWTSNTADTGVIVNGDNVTAYGLFVEHYQKYEV